MAFPVKNHAPGNICDFFNYFQKKCLKIKYGYAILVSNEIKRLIMRF